MMAMISSRCLSPTKMFVLMDDALSDWNMFEVEIPHFLADTRDLFLL